MDPRFKRHQDQLVSRYSRPSSQLSETQEMRANLRSSRIFNVMADWENRRRQMVSRLLERTLDAYINPSKQRGRWENEPLEECENADDGQAAHPNADPE